MKKFDFIYNEDDKTTVIKFYDENVFVVASMTISVALQYAPRKIDYDIDRKEKVIRIKGLEKDEAEFFERSIMSIVAGFEAFGKAYDTAKYMGHIHETICYKLLRATSLLEEVRIELKGMKKQYEVWGFAEVAAHIEELLKYVEEAKEKAEEAWVKSLEKAGPKKHFMHRISGEHEVENS